MFYGLRQVGNGILTSSLCIHPRPASSMPADLSELPQRIDRLHPIVRVYVLTVTSPVHLHGKDLTS